MARNPLFIMVVIVIIAVAFVMIVAQMNAHTPVAGIYSQNNSSANQTGQLIASGSVLGANLMAPIIVITLAITMISVIFLLKKRR